MLETGTPAGAKDIPPVEVAFGAKVPPSKPDADDAINDGIDESSTKDGVGVNAGPQTSDDEIEELYRKILVEKGELADEPMPMTAEEIAEERSLTKEQRNELHLDRNRKMQEKLEKEKEAIDEEIDRIHDHPGMTDADKARLPEREARLKEIDDALSQLARQRVRFGTTPEAVVTADSADGKEKPADVSQEYLDKKAKIEREMRESGQRLKRDLAEISYRHAEKERQALQERIDELPIYERGERAVLDTQMADLREFRLLPELRKLEEALEGMDKLSESDQVLYDGIVNDIKTIEILAAYREAGNLQREAMERRAEIERTLTTEISEMRNCAKGMFSGPTELTPEENTTIGQILGRANQLDERIKTIGSASLNVPEHEKLDQIERTLEQLKSVEQEANLAKAKIALRLQKEQSKSKLERIGGWVHDKSMAVADQYKKIPANVRMGISLGLMAATWWGPGALGAMGGAAYAVNTLEILDKVTLAKRIVGAFATYAFIEKGMQGIQEKDRTTTWKDVAFRRATAGTAAFLVGSGLGVEGVKHIASGISTVAGTVMDWWHASGVALPPVDVASAAVQVTDGSDLVHAGGSGFGGGAMTGVAGSHAEAAATSVTSSVAETQAETEWLSSDPWTRAQQTWLSPKIDEASRKFMESFDSEQAVSGQPPVEVPHVDVTPAPSGAPSIESPEVGSGLPPNAPTVAGAGAEAVAPATAETLATVSPADIAKHTTEGGEQVWADLRKDVVEYARAHNLPVPSPKGVNNVIGNILAQDDPSKIDAEHLKGWLARGVDNFGPDLPPSDVAPSVDLPEAPVPEAPETPSALTPEPAAPTPGATSTASEVATTVDASPLEQNDAYPVDSAPVESAVSAPAPEVTPPAPASFTSSGAMLEDLAKSGAKHFQELPSELASKPLEEQVKYLMNRDLSWLDQKGSFGLVTKWNDTLLWNDMKSLSAEHMIKSGETAVPTSPFNIMHRYLKELGKQVPVTKGEEILPYLERAIKTLMERK